MKTANSHKLILAWVWGASLLGCEAEFDPASHVDSLRVFAVQADRPFAAPGQNVALTALSYDPEGRPMDWAWGVCENPEAATVEACIQKFVAVAEAEGAPPLIAMGEGQDSAQFTVPAAVLEALPAEARSQATVGVLSVACPGVIDLDLGDKSMPFHCLDRDDSRSLGLDEFVVGLKRIFVRGSDVNQNPEIEQVLFDGQDWPADEVKEVDSCSTDGFDYTVCSGSALHRVAARVTKTSLESGRDEFSREFSEQVVIQHYATEGIFEGEVRLASDPETGWVARRRASGSEIRLWFVAHDDRGGVSWTERRVRVR